MVSELCPPPLQHHEHTWLWSSYNYSDLRASTTTLTQSQRYSIQQQTVLVPFNVVGARRATLCQVSTATAPLQQHLFSVAYQWQREAGSAMLWRPPARPHARRSPHGLRAVQRPLLAPTNYTLAYLIILSKTIVEEIIQIAELADWTIRVELKMVSAGFRWCQCTTEGYPNLQIILC